MPLASSTCKARPSRSSPSKTSRNPIASYTRTNFITAKAVARHMAKNGAGVILTLTTPGSRLAGTGYIGYGAACGAVESMSRLLAAELGPSGIRVICLLPHAIPEATAMGSHSRDVFRPFAERAGITVEQMLARHADTTLLKRLPAGPGGERRGVRRVGSGWRNDGNGCESHMRHVGGLGTQMSAGETHWTVSRLMTGADGKGGALSNS